jgi:hypothetical protein
MNSRVGNIELNVPVIRTVMSSSGWRLFIADVEFADPMPAVEG